MSSGSAGRPDYRRALVLGGARSGKSAFAERLAGQMGEPVLYLATAAAHDQEMAVRIRRHRERRPAAWRTVEESWQVARAAEQALEGARTVLLEDLTLLLNNVLLARWSSEATGEAEGWSTEWAESAVCDEVEGLFRLPAHVILVSNEVGMGIVPAYPLGRAFRDALGRVNQAAAARAGEVYLLVAGLPLRLTPAAAGTWVPAE